MGGKRGRDLFYKYKGLIRLIVFFYAMLPLKQRIKVFERHRYTRGIIGLGMRYALLKSISPDIGDNVAIFQGVFLLHPQNVRIGNNVSIQPMCYLECGNVPGGITIGDDVSIAHGATIMGTTHTYSDRSISIREQPVVSQPVNIETDVWIGAKACILCGTTVAQGCIIGAGAVVTKSTETNVHPAVCRDI